LPRLPMTDKARSDLAVATWNALLGAAWPIFTDIGERTARAGTTSAQISLLNVLYDSPDEMTPLAVARVLRVTPGTVTSTLNRLEEAGSIERLRGETRDRRVVKLRITPKGRDLVKRWRESCRAHFEEVMTPLSDAELRTLIALLARLGSPIAGVPEGLASRVKVAAGNPKRSKPRRDG
jgi:DNA-binding MarR family transcriptional regulator